MATNETGNKKRDSFDAPEGFDTNAGREMGKGWLTKEPGSLVQGRLLGRSIMKNQTNDKGDARVFYQVMLSGGTSGIYKDGKKVAGLKGTARDEDDAEEKVEVEFVDGDIVNIGEHNALEDLKVRCNDGGVYDVWMVYVAKDPHPSKKAQTIWRMKGPRLKMLKPPVKRTEDEIPF